MIRPRRGSRGRIGRAARKRVGSAIIFALTVLTPVLVASGTVLSQLRAYSDEVDRRVNGVTTQLVAASGAHEALARLAADVNYRGTFEVQLNGGRSAVDVTQIAGSDTADLTDDLVQVRSEGWLNGPADGEVGLPRDGVRWYRSVVTATVKPRMVRIPVEQTCFIADPSATILVNGMQFRVSGADGASDPGATLPGIGIAGDPVALAAQIPSPLQQYVTGSEGAGQASVLQTAPIDVSAWIQRFVPGATVHWTASNQRLDDYTLGTDSCPAIAVADGDLNIRGTVSGRGALVVLGDLKVVGSLDFAGIIIVGGAASFGGMSGHQTRHRGALMVGGSDVGRDLDIVGDVQIQYDSAALEQLIGEFVLGVKIVTWDHDLDAAAPDGGATGDGGSNP